MRVPPRSAATPLFGLAAVARSLAVGALALLFVVSVQAAGRAAMLSEEALRLAGLATLVVGNLAMLQWFRSGFAGRRATNNRVFEALAVAVCLLGLAVLLLAPLRSAFGLPAAMDTTSVLVLLGLPAAWGAWRLLGSRLVGVRP
jgi:Ca2+-transporting ATPase